MACCAVAVQAGRRRRDPPAHDGCWASSSCAEPPPAVSVQLQQQQPVAHPIASAWALHPFAGNHELWIRERDRRVPVAVVWGVALRRGCDVFWLLQYWLALLCAAWAGCWLAVGGGSWPASKCCCCSTKGTSHHWLTQPSCALVWSRSLLLHQPLLFYLAKIQ